LALRPSAGPYVRVWEPDVSGSRLLKPPEGASRWANAGTAASPPLIKHATGMVADALGSGKLPAFYVLM